MNLSRKNLDQLNSFLNNRNKSKNKTSISNKNSVSKNKKFEVNNPSEIFYSIIDNSHDLQDTLLSNKKLKESEEQLISKKNSYHIEDSACSLRNNQLSEEDLLYDEFNYLLDEE